MKAFPSVKKVKVYAGKFGVIDEKEEIKEGMDLRDYFAAKVMHYWLTYPMTSIHIENMCKGAYHIADEMMKAREQK